MQKVNRTVLVWEAVAVKANAAQDVANRRVLLDKANVFRVHLHVSDLNRAWERVAPPVQFLLGFAENLHVKVEGPHGLQTFCDSGKHCNGRSL
jgi:hypothetical protein